MSAHAFFCTLAHEGVLAVQGPNAEQFLQGQLTCNMKYLASDRSSLGARCTAKGRMQSSFRILKAGEGYLLALAADLLDAQMADLKKYAMFSKGTQLTDASPEWVRFGIVAGEAALKDLSFQLAAEADAVAQADNKLAIRLQGERAEIWAPAAEAEAVKQQLLSTLPEASLNAWLLEQIRAGVGQVFKASYEAFIPQMLNLQCLGAVSFRKGCYTGQEIVARTQHLGKAKRQLQRLAAQGTALECPTVGTALFSPTHSSSVGEVVLAAQSPEGIELLAVLQEDAALDGRITLGTPEGQALTLLPLPYAPDNAKDSQR